MPQIAQYDWPLPRLPGRSPLGFTQNLLASTLAPASYPVAWPAQVPQIPLAKTFQGQRQRNVASFQPAYGPPIERRATSMAMESHSYQVRLSVEQYRVLMYFYTVTLKDGTLEFSRTHPRTGQPIVARFTACPPDNDDIPGYVLTTIQYVAVR